MGNNELAREKTSKNLTIPQKQAVKWSIHDLFIKGWNNRQIHDQINKGDIKISYTAVNRYVNEMIDEENARREKMTDRAYTVAFMKIEGLERKGYELLNKSESDRLKTIKKTRTKGKGKTATTEVETIDEVLQSVGDVRILEFLRQCNRDRLEILRNGKFNAPEETTQQFIQQNNFYNMDVGYRALDMEPIKIK